MSKAIYLCNTKIPKTLTTNGEIDFFLFYFDIAYADGQKTGQNTRMVKKKNRTKNDQVFQTTVFQFLSITLILLTRAVKKQDKLRGWLKKQDKKKRSSISKLFQFLSTHRKFQTNDKHC